ncbi:uncharacterized protein C14orf119 isoform X1 [Maniola hyperantus]|uniref:uncharacterized protein C14orf119 isoform X1 n=2 Tax=Aphantopus hyperantus TaxID=2795564 RepID=UPI001569CBEB|nr:uncharacterized protein C14orf119 isoform X1 [Maniola hyperantus]
MSFLFKSAVCLTMVDESTLHRSYPRSMSNSALTSEAQLRYMLQWFGEFSELQREDFLPVLAAAQSGKPDQLAATLASMSCDDKPVSLFQCRIKLFNEWFPTWAEEDRDRLITAVTEMDADFGIKLQDALSNPTVVNGDASYKLENVSNEEEEKDEELQDTRAVSQENVSVEIAAAS